MSQERSTSDKIALYRSLFLGRTDVYGTYDPKTGRVWQVKKPVTDEVVKAHLRGEQPYGIYLLDADRVRTAAVDFDEDKPSLPLDFVERAEQYRLPAYVERSKSKGYHVWLFFDLEGVSAHSVRLVLRMILGELGQPETEIFPKQDALNGSHSYGNFINAPLFGSFVASGRTVFLDRDMRPVRDQWVFLESIDRIAPGTVEELVKINELDALSVGADGSRPKESPSEKRTFGLPPCTRRMLEAGVTRNQRVACFRIAVQLRKAGLPYDSSLAVLKVWRSKNRPVAGKNIITAGEIEDQTVAAYEHSRYRSCGCEDEAVTPFCDPLCPVRRQTLPVERCRERE